MRARNVTSVVLALTLIWTAEGPAQQTAEELYQAGLYQEEVQGDLQRAIATYERILREHPQNRVVGAQAQFHIGLCYETLGQTEARQAYERVIRDYADQPEVVALARARLAVVVPAPVEGKGPVARRLLSGDDTDQNNLVMSSPSPDGRRLAFVDLQLGGLHLRDLTSGEEEELLPGLPATFNAYPVWSPDGSRLAFLEVSFSNAVASIKILELASRQVAVVSGTDVPYTGGVSNGLTPRDWSRDGRFLLFSGPRLGIAPVVGGAPVTLAEEVAPGHVASLSPDGRYVAYAAGSQGEEQVFVQPVAGGARRQITDAHGGNGFPLWSPDGRSIAYQRPDGVWMMPMTGGEPAGAPTLGFANTANKSLVAWRETGGLYLTLYNEDRVPYQLPVDPSNGVPTGAAQPLPYHPEMVRSFAWSPDRRRLAFVVGWYSADPEIALYSADGSNSSSYKIAEPEERISWVWWTENGHEVLFASGLPQGRGGPTVKALDPSTGRVRALFPRSDSLQLRGLSADGRRALYFDRRSMPDSSRVGWAVGETGAANVRLVAPSVDADGVELGGTGQLSPQGDHLLFTRQADPVSALTGEAGSEAGALWVAASDGTGARKLSTFLWFLSAAWDPSGRLIAYTAQTDLTTTVLRIVDAATGAEREVPLPNGGTQEARVTDWSRDGRFLGIVAHEAKWEYWLLQGLQETGR